MEVRGWGLQFWALGFRVWGLRFQSLGYSSRPDSQRLQSDWVTTVVPFYFGVSLAKLNIRYLVKGLLGNLEILKREKKRQGFIRLRFRV